MNRPRVYVTRRIPAEGLQPIQERCDVRIWEDETPPPYDMLVSEVRDVDGLLCLLTDRIDRGLLDMAKRLRVISTMAVGYDNIDLVTATERGIPVGNTPGVLTETTTDLTWTLLAAAARRIVEADRYTRAGRWRTWGPMTLLGRDVHGATLGIVGMGRIGEAVARRARGFDMHVLYHNRHRLDRDHERELQIKYAPFERLLSESDFVSLHLSLTQETRHLMNSDAFAKMKPTAILVNTARGPIVDGAALYEALRDGVIGGAGLDVTEEEPIPMDDPLLTLENCVILPHIGSASVQTRTRMAQMAAENLLAGLEGLPLPNQVNA
jgi:glyoxylate reductase